MLCSAASLWRARTVSSQRKQCGAECIGHNIHPRSPIGNAGCSRFVIPQHPILCGATHWKSPPCHRKSTNLVPGGTMSNSSGGGPTSVVCEVPRRRARAKEGSAKIAAIIRQQGSIWLAVRPSPDYRIRRTAPEVERGEPSFIELAHEKAHRWTGFLETTHLQRNEH